MDCHLIFIAFLSSIYVSTGYMIYQNGFKPIQPSYQHSAVQEEDPRYTAYTSQPTYSHSPPLPDYAEPTTSPATAHHPGQPFSKSGPLTYLAKPTIKNHEPNYHGKSVPIKYSSKYSSNKATRKQYSNQPVQPPQSHIKDHLATLPLPGGQTMHAREFGLRKRPRYPAAHRRRHKKKHKPFENVGHIESQEHFEPKNYQKEITQQYVQPSSMQHHIQPSQLDDFHDARPQYKYEYGVHDINTGDYKSHEEERDGDSVYGKYELVEPTGAKRTVQYTSDNNKGFIAVVNREHIKHTIPHMPTMNYRGVSYEQSSGKQQAQNEESPKYEHHINYDQDESFQPLHYKHTNYEKPLSNYEPTKRIETPVYENQHEDSKQPVYHYKQHIPQHIAQAQLNSQASTLLQQKQQIYTQAQQEQHVRSQLPKTGLQAEQDQQILFPLSQDPQIYDWSQKQVYAQPGPKQRTIAQPQEKQIYSQPQEQEFYFQPQQDKHEKQTYHHSQKKQQVYSQSQEQQPYFQPQQIKQVEHEKSIYFQPQKKQKVYLQPQQEQQVYSQLQRQQMYRQRQEIQRLSKPEPEQQDYSQPEQEQQVYSQKRQDQQVFPESEDQQVFPESQDQQFYYFYPQEQAVFPHPQKEQQVYSQTQQEEQTQEQEQQFSSQEQQEQQFYSQPYQEQQSYSQQQQKQQIYPQVRSDKNQTVDRDEKIQNQQY